MVSFGIGLEVVRVGIMVEVVELRDDDRGGQVQALRKRWYVSA